jgi:hypothetical protein
MMTGLHRETVYLKKMSKWLSNLVTPLLILLGTILLTAALRGPIDEMANQNRLKATIELAPWISKIEPSEIPIGSDNALDLIMERTQQSTGLLGVARLNLENESGKKVSNISFDLAKYRKTDAVIIDKDQHVTTIINPNKIKIDDLSPGDSVTIIIWGSFSTYELKDNFKSYSSEGEFRTEFFWPENQGIENDLGFLSIVDNFIWYGGSISAILLIIILGAGWSQYYEYSKFLLTYPRAYQAERNRFWENPKDFSPDITLISEKHFKPHALYGNPNEEITSEEDLPKP